jgi:hypothetical protein
MAKTITLKVDDNVCTDKKNEVNNGACFGTIACLLFRRKRADATCRGQLSLRVRTIRRGRNMGPKPMSNGRF